jgi:hypothetical protein
MSHLLYWWKKGSNPEWIYKSERELKNETALTRALQSSAIIKWQNLGVLEVQVHGIPPTKHFRIDFQRLTNIIKDYLEKNPDIVKNYLSQNDQIVPTEIKY